MNISKFHHRMVKSVGKVRRPPPKSSQAACEAVGFRSEPCKPLARPPNRDLAFASRLQANRDYFWSLQAARPPPKIFFSLSQAACEHHKKDFGIRKPLASITKRILAFASHLRAQNK